MNANDQFRYVTKYRPPFTSIPSFLQQKKNLKKPLLFKKKKVTTNNPCTSVLSLSYNLLQATVRQKVIFNTTIELDLTQLQALYTTRQWEWCPKVAYIYISIQQTVHTKILRLNIQKGLGVE